MRITVNVHMLKVLMYDRNETITSVSKKMNIDRGTLTRWFKAGCKNMPMGKMCELIDILNLDRDDIANVFIEIEAFEPGNYII